jgi:hypothetical protein
LLKALHPKFYQLDPISITYKWLIVKLCKFLISLAGFLPQKPFIFKKSTLFCMLIFGYQLLLLDKAFDVSENETRT